MTAAAAVGKARGRSIINLDADVPKAFARRTSASSGGQKRTSRTPKNSSTLMKARGDGM